jgi:hypothetical protein
MEPAVVLVAVAGLADADDADGTRLWGRGGHYC